MNSISTEPLLRIDTHHHFLPAEFVKAIGVTA